MIELSTICVPIPPDQKREIQFCRTHHPLQQDEAPLQLAAVQLSHCMWGLHAWGPRGSDPTAGEVTATDPVPGGRGVHVGEPDQLTLGLLTLGHCQRAQR